MQEAHNREKEGYMYNNGVRHMVFQTGDLVLALHSWDQVKQTTSIDSGRDHLKWRSTSWTSCVQ